MIIIGKYLFHYNSLTIDIDCLLLTMINPLYILNLPLSPLSFPTSFQVHVNHGFDDLNRQQLTVNLPQGLPSKEGAYIRRC